MDCGKPTDCGKLVDCGKSMKSLINQVYNYMHFLYSQACLIRENVKNGNFCHFPQLDWLEGYKNVRENIVGNTVISIQV